MANSSVVGLLKVLLTAETAQFEKALSGADSHVTKLANTMKRDLEPSQKRINMLVRDFLGSKEIGLAKDYAAAVERAGGAARLTAADQAKVNRTVTDALAHYKALGQQAPASMIALANATKQAQIPTEKLGGGIESLIGRAKMLAGMFGVTLGAGALVSLGRQALATAGQITDMASALGVSTDAVQRWKFAAEQTGASMETIGRAVTQMNDRLASGSGSTVQALSDVGLQFHTIRAMKPEDAFNTIATAIGATKDPMVQVRVAMDLFGKSAAEVLPAIKEGMVALGDQAPIMSKETIKALDQAEDRWNALYARVVVSSAGLIARLVALNEEYDKLWDQRVGKVGRDVGRVGTHEMPKTMPAGPVGIQALPPALKAAGDAAKEFDVKFGTLEDNLKKAIGILKASEAAKAAEERYQAWKRAALGLSDAEHELQHSHIRLIHEELARGKGLPAIVQAQFKVNEGLDGITKRMPNYISFLNITGALEKKKSEDLKRIADAFRSMTGLVNRTPTSSLLSGGITGAQIDATGRAAGLAGVDALNQRLRVTSELMAVAAQSGSGMFRLIVGGAQQAVAMVGQYIVSMKAAKVTQDAVAASAAAASIAMGIATLGITAAVVTIAKGKAGLRAFEDEIQALRDAILALNATPVIGPLTEFVLPKDRQGMLKVLRDQLKEIQENTDKLKTKFGDLSQSLQVFGGVVPKSLQPLVKELLTSKHLTADMRKELEAMSGAPTWQVMQERAEKLGIALSALGSNFSQARISDIALQYVRDLTMFEDQSADMTEVLRGMADELSMVAQEAITSGAALPKTLEPYMKRLAEMGLLLDANGQLIDMGALSFKDIEDEALKQMVSFLEEIRDLLREIGRISIGAPQVPVTGFGGMSMPRPRVGVGAPGLEMPMLPDFGGASAAYMGAGAGVSTRVDAGGGGTFNIYAIDAPSFETFLKQRGGAEAVVRSLPPVVERWGGAR